MASGNGPPRRGLRQARMAGKTHAPLLPPDRTVPLGPPDGLVKSGQDDVTAPGPA